jgi:hypothetical protein
MQETLLAIYQLFKTEKFKTLTIVTNKILTKVCNNTTEIKNTNELIPLRISPHCAVKITRKTRFHTVRQFELSTSNISPNIFCSNSAVLVRKVSTVIKLGV